MNNGTTGVQGVRALPEGRMTEQDADRFRLLLTRLESSLAADRRVAGQPATDRRGTDRRAGAPAGAQGRDD
ncbi:hypothetical protein ACGFZP_30460 [Kitasatospora sp. NPDC048239]|uniref:hypothetical protein n=1 Tax=Kitasatospora sp. NPDC048239 TaxID=3364046 RepID=UPI003718C14A